MTAEPGSAPRPRPVPGERGFAEPARLPARAAGLGASRPGALLAVTGWAAALAALFCCYLRLSRTMAIESDACADPLQTWAWLHGNMLDLWFDVGQAPQVFAEAIYALSS